MNRAASATLPLRGHVFDIHVFTDGEQEHVALCLGGIEATDSSKAPLVRVHSKCLTGDAFGSTKCDCQGQLNASLARIAEEQCGVLVYLDQEGRGIGLVEKIKAYALQDQGMDTDEANVALGHKVDERTFAVAGNILKALKVSRVRLLTNNPSKVRDVESAGITVESREELWVEIGTEEGKKYAEIKRSRMGHLGA